jgi:hypothetical protein
LDVANSIPWVEFTEMLREEYCSRNEIQKLEQEFWNLSMNNADIKGYTNRFQDLCRLCPTMVTPEYKKIERYIWGLAPQIQSMVTSATPSTIQIAIRLAHQLTDQGVRQGTLVEGDSFEKNCDNKRKWGNDSDETHAHQVQKKQETVKVYVAGPTERNPRGGYHGNLPKCDGCGYHHRGTCEEFKCKRCNRFGHTTKNCGMTNEQCYECGNTGHFRKDCPNLKQTGGNNACNKAFVMITGEPQHDPNIDTDDDN